MTIFFGETAADERAAKVKALQEHYKDKTKPIALSMLQDNALDYSKQSGEDLIISAHGNRNNLGQLGITGAELFDTLRQKGLNGKRFSRIFLVACDVGEQAQNNSITQNFARDFKNAVNMDPTTSSIKVYAPRGLVKFATKDERVERQTVLRVTNITIVTREKEYALDEGMLLVQPV